MLKKLIELLPISRRAHLKDINEMLIVIDGLVEAEANHCQIEMGIMQQLQKNKMGKSPSPAVATKKSRKDVAFQ